MIPRPFAEMASVGVSVPPRVVTNHDLAKTLDTSDEWIVERTGIRERRIAGPEQTVAMLSREASELAMERAGVTAADLDSIILGTASPDRLLPSTACDLQALLGATNAAAFDVSAACPGFVYALTVAEGLIASGQSRTVLVIGAEKLSTITDFQDRSTAILFGDGAGAAIVRRSSGNGRGLLSTFLKSDGRLAPLLYRPGGGAADPISERVVCDRSHFMRMAGREVFKAAVLAMAEACDEALSRAGVAAEEIDLLVPHQANLRIIEATAKHAGIPMSKVMVNLDRYGNTSSASIPLALDQAVAEGRVRPGSLVLLVAFGAGFTWGERGDPVVSVLMFPGQGAQKVGMGRDLADRFPEARATFAAVDDALGVELSRIMWEGPEEELTLTHNAQPAILAHSAAVLSVVAERLGGVGAAAGHSLGEYSAHVAARTLTVAAAATLVRRRGELMLEAGKKRPGAMAAVLGLPTLEVEAACNEASTGDGVAVAANLNAPDQTVISGDPPAVNRAGEACKTRGAKRVVPLKVSGAFHSPLMAPAVDGLREALSAARFATPDFPVVANASAEEVTTGVDAKRLLADQLTAPVRWVESMQRAAALVPNATFVELGPGNVLSGLLKRIVPGAATLTLGTAAELEKFLQ